MNTQQQSVYRVRPDGVVWRAAGEEIVLLDIQTSVYFGLDRWGSFIWTHLAEGATVADLVAALVATAPVERVRAADDVAEFVDALLRHGLIQRG
jgi:Coenzyme PQQ synthesis protein D (PqqD)